MFENVRDEEMEAFLSPEKLREAARSPSVRRAFEELRAASLASKTPTRSGELHSLPSQRFDAVEFQCWHLWTPLLAALVLAAGMQKAAGSCRAQSLHCAACSWQGQPLDPQRI